MCLCVAMECDSVRAQPLQMQNGWNHALSAEAIQRPEQHAIELAATCILEQGRELLAALGTLTSTLLINILGDDVMAGIGAPCTQLRQLVLGVLPLIVGAHATVERHTHRPS